MAVHKIFFDDLFFDDYYPLEQLREMKRARENEVGDLEVMQENKAFKIFFGFSLYGLENSGKSKEEFDTFGKWFETFFEQIEYDAVEYIECVDLSEWDVDADY